MSRSDSCILCRKSSFVDTPYHYVFRGRIIHIVRCSLCGLGTLQPMLSSEEVISLYGPEYFERDYHCGVLAGRYEDEVENLREEMSSLLPTIQRYAPGKSYLELGCAGGAMLSMARDRGFETTGVEISQEMAEWGRKHLGLDIRKGTLEEQRLPTGSYDVVFLGDVIEHLLNPSGVLDEIHRLLSPDGIIALAFPMELNHIVPRMRKLLKASKRSSNKPYHLHYFDLKTMRVLLEHHGFSEVFSREDKLIRTEPLLTCVLDSLNMFITMVTHAFGDRGIVVGRRRA